MWNLINTHIQIHTISSALLSLIATPSSTPHASPIPTPSAIVLRLCTRASRPWAAYFRPCHAMQLSSRFPSSENVPGKKETSSLDFHAFERYGKALVSKTALDPSIRKTRPQCRPTNIKNGVFRPRLHCMPQGTKRSSLRTRKNCMILVNSTTYAPCRHVMPISSLSSETWTCERKSCTAMVFRGEMVL